MRAILYGSEKTTERFKRLLEDEGIEVIVIPEPLNETVNQWEEEDFDLAIIDSRMETAELAYKNIRECGNTPIALLVDPAESNWSKLLPLDADCYLPETKDKYELAARLRALIRRFSNKRPTVNRSGKVSGWVVSDGFALKQSYLDN